MQPEIFKLLLDQGFPKPPGFTVTALDRSVLVEHLNDVAPELSQRSTPDWYVYCFAARSGFDALVVRDRSQLSQTTEMYALSRLPELTVVTWRKVIDDPVREWGQLLAYLPQIKTRCREKGGRVIVLPSPTLTPGSYFEPSEILGRESQRQGVSNRQVRDDARQEMTDWLEINGEPPDLFDDVLGLPS